MKDKNIVALLGVGGNFKSSLARELEKLDYILIPEGNRQFERNLEKDFDRISDPELNYEVKKVLLDSFLRLNFDKFVCDRTLIDYALMNEFIKKILLHYNGVKSDKISLDLIYNEELKLFNGYSVKRILLTTSDKSFVKAIIDDAFDIRACFFDDSDSYFKCQDLYANFILKNFNNVVHIDLNDIPLCEKDSPEILDYIDKIKDQLLLKIN